MSRPKQSGDIDNPEWTEEDFKRARPASEVLEREIMDELRKVRRMRGKQKAPTKKVVSIRLDPDVIEFFRSTDRGWQTRINDTLKRVIELPSKRRAKLVPE